MSHCRCRSPVQGMCACRWPCCREPTPQCGAVQGMFAADESAVPRWVSGAAAVGQRCRHESTPSLLEPAMAAWVSSAHVLSRESSDLPQVTAPPVKWAAASQVGSRESRGISQLRVSLWVSMWSARLGSVGAAPCMRQLAVQCSGGGRCGGGGGLRTRLVVCVQGCACPDCTSPQAVW